MSTVPSTVFIRWIHSTLMMGMDSRGRSMLIGKDNESNPEWLGLKPSDLLLLSAASCTAHDVITILKKQREPVLGFEIICTGEQLSNPPHSFVGIKLKYLIKGNIDKDKLEKAISLSEEKYCSVISTLKLALNIDSSYEIIGQE
jgi:putative redox protein